MKIWARSRLVSWKVTIPGTLLTIWAMQLLSRNWNAGIVGEVFDFEGTLAAVSAGLGDLAAIFAPVGFALSQPVVPGKPCLLEDVSGSMGLFHFATLGTGLALASQWIHSPTNSGDTTNAPDGPQRDDWRTRVLENPAVAVCWVGPDGKILRANQTELDLLGYAETEYVGHPMAEFFADSSAFEATLHRLKRGETPPAFPARMHGKVGSLLEVLVCPQLIVEDGKFHEACYVKVDLTQEKTHTVPNDSEQRFQNWADAVPVLIWMSDLQKEGSYFNKFWSDFTGEPAKNFQGDGWLECVHPDDREPLAKIWDEHFRTRRRFTTEFRLRRADGTYRWMLDTGSPRVDEDGTFQGFIGSCVDITDRKQADVVQSRLAAIVESSDDAIVSKTLEGIILSWNGGAEKIFGYSAEELVGQPITTIIPPELHDEETMILEKLRRGERIDHYETIRVGKDGRRIAISLTISPIRNAQGQIVAASKVARDITAERQAQEELRRNEERFRELANNINQFAWTCDETGAITWYNQRWYDYTGTTFEQMKGWGWTAVQHPDYVDRVVQRIQHAFATGEPWEDTFPLRGKDGEYRWFLSRAQPIRDREGRVIRWLGTNTDITKQLQAEEALRESEERFRSMANITPAILWTTLPDGTVTWLSDRWYEYTGMSRQDDLENWYQMLHPEDVGAYFERWHQSLKEGVPYEIQYRYQRHDGEYRWFLAQAIPVRDAEGQIVGWCGSSTEIHNQKQMEQSQRFLAEASKSLASLVDYKSTLQVVAKLSIPGFADWCTVDILDREGLPKRLAVAHVDPAKVRFAEELGDTFRNAPDAPRGVMKVVRTGKSEMATVITEEMVKQLTTHQRHWDLLETLSPCSYICVPLMANTECLGVITFVTAESGRRYGLRDLEVAEDLARRATIAIENARLYQEVQEAHRRKDEFLAMLAHELRNPLAPIRSGLDILAMDEERDQETLRVMQDQLEHVVRLVDDLLDVSRIIRNKVELRKEIVSLSSLIQRSVEAARHSIEKLNQVLLVSLPEEPVWLEADPVRIIQVIENLLNNASKYTEKGGRLELTGERKGNEVEIRLRDTGMGIEPDLLPNVFDLFTQAQRSLDRAQGGLGIGLTLVQRLVAMHNGTVAAYSDGPNQGSTFIVKLPVTNSIPQRSGEVVQNANRSKNRKIVVVDDNVGAAKMLSKLLGMLGDHQVLTAHDGPSALEAIFEMHPEIVLLDIGLPGMNGYQVAKAVRERPQFDDVLLVALTGYGQKEDRMRSHQAGFDEHRVKPPSLEQMRNLLQHPKLDQRKIPQTVSEETLPKPNAPQKEGEAPQAEISPMNEEISSSSRAEDVTEIRQFKHDLGNVAHVLCLIRDFYLKADATPDLIDQAHQGLANEIDTINGLMTRLQKMTDHKSQGS